MLYAVCGLPVHNLVSVTMMTAHYCLDISSETLGPEPNAQYDVTSIQFALTSSSMHWPQETVLMPCYERDGYSMCQQPCKLGGLSAGLLSEWSTFLLVDDIFRQ